MRRCLELASLGRWNVGNGALVGAVLVRGDTIIAEGYHSHFGGPHAERMLLENYQGTIEPDDVLYVNLEPCCHTGKTPPCTDIIIERGVKHVVYGMLDSDHRVAGKGSEVLRSKGVTAEGPFLRTECEYANRGFTTVRMEGRPWVTIKMAMDRAGRISNDDGSPLKITSNEQDVWSHTWLRSRHDAILVGVQTIIADDPSLNTRFAQNTDIPFLSGLNTISDHSLNKKMIQKKPLRIILDPHFRIPVDARVCDASLQPTLICVVSESLHNDYPKARALKDKGAIIKEVELASDGGFAWASLWNALLTPSGDYHGITSILVEGGLKTWRAFSERDVDEQVKLTGL
jgi:diaminohydroxyphosphoribosylaminopyrimidine deaminase/5-amino-6-(5-phosphoribosylamino)uracil reductase